MIIKIISILALLVTLAEVKKTTDSSYSYESQETVLNETFTEALHIQPLSKKYTSFTFNFETTSKHPHRSSKDSPKVKHYSLLRRSISQLVEAFDVLELHLGFTRGGWDYERFGDPLENIPVQSGAGVEVAAWIHNSPKESVTPKDFGYKWQDLIHTLSGMFCATLAAASRTTLASSPRLSFAPRLNISLTKDGSFPEIELKQNLFHAHLPQESACTENLTPWIKQLPCRHHSGLASLLKPHIVFNSHYSSIALDIYPVCKKTKCSSLSDFHVVSSQSLTLVLDSDLISSNWALSTVFKHRIEQPCPLAQKSEVVFYSDKPITEEHITQKACRSSSLVLSPPPPGGWSCEGKASYSLAEGESFDVLATSNSNANNADLVSLSQLIKVERHIVDRIGLQGGLVIEVSNLADSKLAVSFFQTLPWFLQPYLHTLRLSVDGSPYAPVEISSSSVISKIFFQPSMDLQKLSALEMLFNLPPKTTIKLHVEFIAKFLSLDQYPPDPNRGFSVGPAVVTLLENDFPVLTHNQTDLLGKRYYTSTLVVFLPTPDFSMPYNVATFTSTIFALYFGSVFNSLTRQFSLTLKP